MADGIAGESGDVHAETWKKMKNNRSITNNTNVTNAANYSCHS